MAGEHLPDDDHKMNDFQVSQLKHQQFGSKKPKICAVFVIDIGKDVFSYGVIVWEMLTRQLPFHKMNDFQVTLFKL